MIRTPEEIKACIAEVTRLTSAPAHGMEHTLDDGRCTDPRCAACSPRTTR